MTFINRYRDGAIAQDYARAIAATVTRDWNIMEICGGQTHTIVKFGLDQLLPDAITLIHGPGCPVCVTAEEFIDQAIALAQRPEVVLCSFGDMLRVPGSETTDLLSARAMGGDVRIVYSPLDALAIAQANPEREIVFFAVGFETTAPATAMAVYQAAQMQIPNFSLLVSHVRVPPAMEMILSSPHCQVQGFLAAGHVCTVMGYQNYGAIASKYQVPIVVTGFEPVDILQGIYYCVQQLEEGRSEVENQYARSVQPYGNRIAQNLIDTVFEPVARYWRGIGEIANSGLSLRSTYEEFDACIRFNLLPCLPSSLVGECISGYILQGLCKPPACPAFGKSCTPDRPLGAPMVSSEGACAAYYRYRQPA